MAETGILIDGQRVNIPGVYPVVNVEGMTPPALGFTGIIGVIAPSDGGLPNTIYRFQTYDQAKAVLRGGRILSYLARMFRPSADINGAREVRFIRANSLIQSGAVDYSVVEGATLMNISARDAGAWTNSIRVGCVVGSDDATLVVDRSSGNTAYKPKTFTVSNLVDRVSASYVFRNGVNVMAPSGSTFEVDATNRKITLSTNSTVIDVAAYSDVPTFADLVAWVNLHAGWTAVSIGPSYFPTESLNDCSGSPKEVSNLAVFMPAESGLLAWLLNTANPTVKATLSSVPQRLVALSPTYLSGGAGRGSDTLDSEALTSALTIAETTRMDLMWVQSADFSCQQLLLAHCAAMSTNIARKYRIAVMGINFTTTSPVDGPTAGATSLDNAIEIARNYVVALDGPGVYCMNGTTWANPATGVQEQLGGLGLAAQVVGMKSGGQPGTPLTNKTLLSTGLEFPNITDAQKSAVLDLGILMPFYDAEDSTTNILQAITTRQSTNPMLRTFHGLYITHEIARLEIRVLSRFIGAPLDLGTGELIKAGMAKGLDSAIISGTNPNGYLTEGRKADGTRVPAWENLTVSGDSTTGGWTIRVNPHPIGETDFIQVINNLTPAPIEL